jgi:hypothetical protein
MCPKLLLVRHGGVGATAMLSVSGAIRAVVIPTRNERGVREPQAFRITEKPWIELPFNRFASSCEDCSTTWSGRGTGGCSFMNEFPE